MKTILALVLYLLVLFPSSVYAVKVTGLYQTSVPVGDESLAARKPALRQALIQVLIKLTGDRNISQNTSAITLSEQPDRYLQQFRYRQATSNEKLALDGTILWVQFDEVALNEALRNYGLNIWGKERPLVLLWLAHEDNEFRRLVSFEESPEYLEMLDRQASARGMSLLFPLLDLEDTSRISVSDIWGGFKEPIQAASSRYHADVLFVGKLIQVLPTLWEAQWQAYIGEQSLNWMTRGELAEIVLEEGVNELIDNLAEQYVNVGFTRTEVLELLVTEVNDLDDYARTLAYLESLGSVSEVQVKKLSQNKVMFELIIHGDLATINQSIALGNILEPQADSQLPSYRLLAR